MNRVIKIVLSIVALIAFAVTASGCSTASTASDEQALHYNGGAFSSKTFKNCIEPSTRNFDSPGDGHFTYPHGQRTYSFTGQKGSEHDPVAVTTREGQEVDVPGFLTFTLTDDCELLREFHEKIGSKYEAYDDAEGWASFLNDYIYTPLNSALNKAAQDIVPAGEGETLVPAWTRLYTSTSIQTQFSTDVETTLPELVESALGGKYITVNSVQISKPIVDAELKAAIQSKQVAQQENAAQTARNAKILTQYDTIKNCLDTGLDRQNCTLIFLEQNGADIPFLTIPQGGAVNYQAAPPAE